MNNLLKKSLRLFVGKLFSFFGYSVAVWSSKEKHLVLVDQKVWAPHVRADENIERYVSGLRKSQNEWSDNLYKQLRHYSLQELCNYVLNKNLRGDLVECGCWSGHSAYQIASIIKKRESDVDFHIFDSFEGGLSAKVPKDENIRVKLSEKEIKKESKIFGSTETEVKSCLADFDRIYLYKGWILDRFDEISEKKFSLVHLDVDLYEPTRDSLAFFFPRLVEDGVIVCDDYGCSQFPGAAAAVDEFLVEHKVKMFYRVPMGSCFIIK
jgi:O-methyltransferase